MSFVKYTNAKYWVEWKRCNKNQLNRFDYNAKCTYIRILNKYSMHIIKLMFQHVATARIYFHIWPATYESTFFFSLRLSISLLYICYIHIYRPDSHRIGMARFSIFVSIVAAGAAVACANNIYLFNWRNEKVCAAKWISVYGFVHGSVFFFFFFFFASMCRLFSAYSCLLSSPHFSQYVMIRTRICIRCTWSL